MPKGITSGIEKCGNIYLSKTVQVSNVDLLIFFQTINDKNQRAV